VEVKVSDPAFVYDLICSLKSASYSAAQLTTNTIVVRMPDRSNGEAARRQLGCYLANWRARHPGVDADLVDPRPGL
jgi:hypothetical protein